MNGCLCWFQYAVARSAPPEDIEIASMGIAAERLLHLQRQAVHATPHVGVAHRQPDPDARGNRDHPRSADSTHPHFARKSPPDHPQNAPCWSPSRVRSPSPSLYYPAPTSVIQSPGVTGGAAEKRRWLTSRERDCEAVRRGLKLM